MGEILDSGNRRLFDTGAVRDIQEGKGRCDLLPLEVVAWVLGGGIDADAVMDAIHQFEKYGHTAHLFAALEHFRAVWGIPMETLLIEVSKHFEEGCKKYGERNWQKGIPTSCYIDSAVRHYLKWLREDKDEPHDRAFCWNILCCIWTCWNKPELDTYSKEVKAE